MEQMSEAFEKELFTRRDGRNFRGFVEAATEEQQPRFMHGEIERFREREVLTRKWLFCFGPAVTPFPLEVEAQRAGRPYVKYGGFRFLELSHQGHSGAPPGARESVGQPS